MVSRVIPVDPFDLTIFGGTGDLAKRKILPGLFRRHLSIYQTILNDLKASQQDTTL